MHVANDITVPEKYLKEEIERDYESGYSIDYIAKCYKKSQEVDFENKISSKKAYQKVCEIIYNHIMKQGHI